MRSIFRPSEKKWATIYLLNNAKALSRVGIVHPIPVPLMQHSLRIENLLAGVSQLKPLRDRVMLVLENLPAEVVRDFLEDPNFRIAVDDFHPARGRIVWLAGFSENGHGSRSVVLKPKLARCSTAFACYVIAHEFAHAYLRNGGWGHFSDREEAADALSTSWGFAPQPWEV